jgi:hypothetical protein
MSPMSSAILYLAIVAIWACVLIPRWLKRDSAHGAATPLPLAEPAAEDGAAPGAEAVTEAAEDENDSRPAPVRVTSPAGTAESRRRMLTARRRLLLMLLGLEAAAITLALSGLAAVWVVVPPTIMLGGYLLLLREAAAADREQAQYEAEAATRAAERARTRSPRVAHATPPEGVSTEGVPAAAAALLAKFAAAPVPADYEDAGPGRDFAPGLAGKYTTSTAEVALADEDNADPEDADDSYEMPRLRAVGD